VFHGHPYEAEDDAMLQVGVARLLGYRWPAELDPDMRLSDRARALADECEELVKFADKDGIVCIPAVRGEEPAADRLLRLLAACDIEPGVDLDDWLRNSFFQEHCEMFGHRPFVWHIWDGRKRDGFHALVNYHKLCECDSRGRKLLESLTYSYLGDWITRQTDGVKRGEGGAEDRLAAATALQERLVAILEGEPPFDLFVRWKPLGEQPVGWEPDINDGVRINIRPFMAADLPNGRKGAGVLRYKPNVHWKKDRGKEPQRPKAEYPWFWGWDGKTEDFVGGKEFDGVRPRRRELAGVHGSGAGAGLDGRAGRRGGHRGRGAMGGPALPRDGPAAGRRSAGRPADETERSEFKHRRTEGRGRRRQGRAAGRRRLARRHDGQPGRGRCVRARGLQRSHHRWR
jgi:hypothetical protein